jgi:hypothetical protein
MRRISKVSAVTATLLLGASGVSALEDSFSRPRYKDGSRLDWCYGFSQACGQRAADTWCRIQGYEKATRFETERATPTRVMGDGKMCSGSVCTAYRRIVCFTSSAKRGRGTDWPSRL